MAYYMQQVAYTSEAWAYFAENPHNRGEVFAAHLEKYGGRLLGFYYTFGEYETVAFYQLPDDTTAAAFAISVAAPGYLKAVKTTKLYGVDEAMEAMRKAGSNPYPKIGDKW
ncbi:MAG: GYD domain-containing protein [Chloroflexi bacterium]|nr:GYD domain-containing protein [Chloroflexota bacterium]